MQSAGCFAGAACCHSSSWLITNKTQSINKVECWCTAFVYVSHILGRSRVLQIFLTGDRLGNLTELLLLRRQPTTRTTNNQYGIRQRQQWLPQPRLKRSQGCTTIAFAVCFRLSNCWHDHFSYFSHHCHLFQYHYCSC